MSDRRLPAAEATESILEKAYRAADPGPAPAGLRAAVGAIPASHDRDLRSALDRFSVPAAALAAAAVLVLLVWQGLGLPSSPFGGGATPTPSVVPFDPTLVGPGLAEPSSSFAHWVVVGFVAALLVLWATGFRGLRRLLALGGAVAVLAYAAFCTFVPVDVHLTGWGPGIAVQEVVMPAGAQEYLYYETAQPFQPFSFGLDLLSSDGVPVRIESVVTDVPVDRQAFVGMRWTSVWLDGEPNGGMIGPAEPFAPFELPRNGHAIWIVGRASYCALGHAPAAGEDRVGTTWLGDLRLNVTVLGWPRVVNVQDGANLRLVEPSAATCPAPPGTSSPSVSPSP